MLPGNAIVIPISLCRRRTERKRSRRGTSGRFGSPASKAKDSPSSSREGYISPSPMPLRRAALQDTEGYHARAVDALELHWNLAVPRVIRELRCKVRVLRPHGL